MALSSLSAVLSGGIWVFSGVSGLSIYCLALSGHTMELSGLPPLCLGESFPVEALFGPTVTLTRLTPPYLALPGPAVAHPGLPLHCLALFFFSASPDSLICPTSPYVLSHFSPACPISLFSNAFLHLIKHIEQTVVAFPNRVSR